MVRRLVDIPGFSIDRVAEAAGDDPEVLRLENLDSDLPPPPRALAVTRAALESEAANSYLPFTGTVALRSAVAERLRRQTGHPYDPNDVVITCGGTEGMFDALLAVTDPGDEVLLTDPTYAGMVNRVRLAGAVPRFAPLVVERGEWRLDVEGLRAAVSERTRAVFFMNPSMPSGALLDASEWDAIAALCRERSLWLLYNAAMERILFDGRACAHPAALPGMAERTITIGSVSKEYRMIGWRIGWVAGPPAILRDVARVHVYNVVTATGIAQAGAAAALAEPASELAPYLAEWQRRRDALLGQLEGLPAVRPAGGWSLLLDVGAMGFDSRTASRLLLERGRVAATPMRDWGSESSDRFVRLVFSREPVARLAQLRARLERALGA
ncbi:MAG: pyridoxal phosphate-dependent aminotransferase [Gemmatimonadetes bacterium]|nr:pyridoxal phosphate-dependent aminotransferase [Gemmatimonadota bacterium]